jgi:triacylglycerol lipase
MKVQEAPRTAYPIILAHGICPFDRILRPLAPPDNAPDDARHYFRKIRSTLMDHGFSVFHSRVAWAGTLERRASELKANLLRISEGFSKWPRVHIFGHSMGGLDARWMLYRFRMEERVASLTTIGTPHHGTAYADWGLRRFDGILQALNYLGLTLEGLRDLTRAACRSRNALMQDFEDHCGVRYQTVVGAQSIERIFAPMRFSYRIIQKEEGENDGLVPLGSAEWKEGRVIERMDADHLNQIGWWDPAEGRAGFRRETFEAGIRETYVRIAEALRD